MGGLGISRSEASARLEALMGKPDYPSGALESGRMYTLYPKGLVELRGTEEELSSIAVLIPYRGSSPEPLAEDLIDPTLPAEVLRAFAPAEAIPWLTDAIEQEVPKDERVFQEVRVIYIRAGYIPHYTWMLVNVVGVP